MNDIVETLKNRVNAALAVVHHAFHLLDDSEETEDGRLIGKVEFDCAVVAIEGFNGGKGQWDPHETIRQLQDDLSSHFERLNAELAAVRGKTLELERELENSQNAYHSMYEAYTSETKGT